MFSSWGFRTSRIDIEDQNKAALHFNRAVLSWALRRLRQWRCFTRTRKICFQPTNPFAHPQETLPYADPSCWHWLSCRCRLPPADADADTDTPVRTLTRSDLSPGTAEWRSERWDQMSPEDLRDSADNEPVRLIEDPQYTVPSTRAAGLPPLPRPSPRNPSVAEPSPHHAAAELPEQALTLPAVDESALEIEQLRTEGILSSLFISLPQ